MTFLYSTRSLKRNRLLKKISMICLVLSLVFLFYLAKNGPDNELRLSSSFSSSIQHQRYHLHDNDQVQFSQNQDEEVEIDVTVPRHALLDTIRKAKQDRLSRTKNTLPPVLPDRPKQPSLSPTTTITTIPEDKVFKSSRDDLYLPLGDGKDPNEKYLGFYPHSGFHNQRIALVNALMLAERLNRTLLVPPVMLGNPIHWRKHDSLDSYHRRTSKARLTHCQSYLNPQGKVANDSITIPDDCQLSFKYTSLRWDRLFDLDNIKQRVRIRYRDDYERTYLERYYNISRADTYYIKDDVLYDYRIVEANRLNSSKPVTVGKYQRIITVQELEERSERMLSFGSLFGNGRVIVNNQMATLDYFNRQLIFQRSALPGLFDEMDRMLHLLGGPSSYIAIHARVGDSIFERYAPQVMEKLWSDLQIYVPLLKQQQPMKHNDRCYQTDDDLGPAIDWDKQVILDKRPLVMFMATDTPRPHEHELFQNIYDTFPCIVTLNDLFDFDTSPLATMINPEDGVNYGKFLIPFLDGLMASRAQSFSGSMWSTFSKYIQFLHNVYTTSH
ncbi:uncharacterized protein BX664DRAFT_319693 [Halteromyces radiatus]|uniref:uncharacterized protein n=1 Tax=Halteromyces radiatus TaxID=101107 RepID=UPI00221EC671|nr:uncharacterized protein BX664DRAFT_319693 [Halteromyces radiatus]KAI8098827.1 hypothetical protein BX664DRAFT_319693 [Halteromyces radiatus]